MFLKTNLNYLSQIALKKMKLLAQTCSRQNFLAMKKNTVSRYMRNESLNKLKASKDTDL